MKNDVYSTLPAAGSIGVWRTNLIKAFAYGPGEAIATAREALDAAMDFRSTHRRAERCSIWLNHDTELSPAGEAEPVKGAKAPKKDKSARRAARKEKRQEDILAIRAQVRAASFADNGIAATESESKLHRKEAFREVRARVTVGKSVRVMHFRGGRGKTIVTGANLDAVR